MDIVTINCDLDHMFLKGALAKVIAYDRDKRYLVELLENTTNMNVGDKIWLKPHWFDNFRNKANERFTHIHKFPYSDTDTRSKKERWVEYKEGSRRSKVVFDVTLSDNVRYMNLTRKQVLTKLRHALKNDLDINVAVYYTHKWGSYSGYVLESIFIDNSYSIEFKNFKKIDGMIKNFQKKLEKIILAW